MEERISVVLTDLGSLMIEDICSLILPGSPLWAAQNLTYHHRTASQAVSLQFFFLFLSNSNFMRFS